jgi:hypothetical protein
LIFSGFAGISKPLRIALRLALVGQLMRPLAAFWFYNAILNILHLPFKYSILRIDLNSCPAAVLPEKGKKPCDLEM